MKIERSIYERLAAEQAQRQARRLDGGGFGALLARELDKTSARLDPSQVALNTSTVQQLGATDDDSRWTAGNDNSGTQQLAASVDQVLNDLERYANRLGSQSSDGDLKEAYEVLDRISSTVDALRKDASALNANPELRAMVDELGILTVTETFKFNRGDYA